MGEVVIGEFEIVAEPAPVPADTSDSVPPAAAIDLLELEAVVRRLQARALRCWVD